MFWHTATSSLLMATKAKVITAAVAALTVAGGVVYATSVDDSREAEKAAVAPQRPANRIAPPPLAVPTSDGATSDPVTEAAPTAPATNAAPATQPPPPAAGTTKTTSTATKNTKKSTNTGTRAPAPAQAPDTEAPSAPTGLTGTNLGTNQFDSHIILDWEASTDNVGVVGYRIYFRTNMGEWEQVHDIHDGSTDDTVVASEAFARENFAVRAYDAAGNESEAATVHVDVPFAV